MRRRIQHHDLCHSTLTHTHTTSKSEVVMLNPAPHININNNTQNSSTAAALCAMQQIPVNLTAALYNTSDKDLLGLHIPCGISDVTVKTMEVLSNDHCSLETQVTVHGNVGEDGLSVVDEVCKNHWCTQSYGVCVH